MYERHFGITGLPFQLSPDPSFYFDGSQHRAALAALRSAFIHDPPFIVLSGEIGAGKTTVLRAWLAEAEAAGVIAAQVTNTQLDVDDLLAAIARAFGMTPPSDGDGTAAEVLRDFLSSLNGKAAVLAIDEAQNLTQAALKSLVDLTQVAKDQSARFRVFLSGQPELRTHVADVRVPGLQARIQQACHLDAFESHQTRQYIEHRLSKVGWKGVPSFDPSAFEEIHRLTGGVPRRINVLANRLLLGQYLNGTERIDCDAVAAGSRALDAEIGDGAVTYESPREANDQPDGSVALGALLILASGRSDYIKAMALMSATDKHTGLPPTVVVGLSKVTTWRLNVDLQRQLGLTNRFVALADPPAVCGSSFDGHFEGLLHQCKPSAVLVFDGNTLLQCCAAVASRLGVPLVHVGADPQAVEELNDPGSSRAAISQLAALRFDCRSDSLDRGTAPVQPSLYVGNLLVDALQLSAKQAKRDTRWTEQLDAIADHVDAMLGYGVVALKQSPEEASVACRPGALHVLDEASRDLPLVWPMHRTTTSHARSSGLVRTFEGDRIARIDELSYVNFVRLMSDATCVLTDSLDVVEEAAALGVPCLSLGNHHVSHVDFGGWLPATDVGVSSANATRAIWQILFGGGRRVALPALWDGQAGMRIAEHLSQWFGPSTEGQRRGANLRHAFHTTGQVGLDHPA